MTFFPLSRNMVAITFVIAALAGVAMARPKSIEVLCSAPNGSALRPLS